MTKRERVMAALARQRVDRPPVAFWRHVPEVDHDPRKLAAAMLDFHHRFDLDFIKLMSSGVYCVEDWGCRVAYTGEPNGAKRCTAHAIQQASDWERIAPLAPDAGALGRELEALRLVVRGRDDDAPVLHTIFSPLTIARKLAGDRLERDLTAAPEIVLGALGVIARTVARYAAAALEAGADGLFLATQVATPEGFPQSAWAHEAEPFLASLVASVTATCPFILLHAHGRQISFDKLATLPVQAMNWHDRVTEPSLENGQRRFAGAVVGGLGEWQTLRHGPAAAVVAETRDAIAQTGGLGLIVAPGCVLPLDVPAEHLDAVVDTVKSCRQP
jgi:uroporphyrinogen decarboxylase